MQFIKNRTVQMSLLWIHRYQQNGRSLASVQLTSVDLNKSWEASPVISFDNCKIFDFSSS